MQIYSKLKKYPLGAIKADGFLRDQLLRGKSGMAGNLYKLEPEMIADPFIKKSYVKAWVDGNQEGWGAEISGNFWTGYIQHAWVLDDAEMKKIATEWVDAVLKRQRPDGYLGTYCEEGADMYDDYNAWGTACGMRGLLAFYEATGRRDVLDAVHACMLWFVRNWSGDKKTCYAGPFIIETMIFTYYYTGDESLVRFSEEYLEYITEHDLFSISYKKMLTDEYHYNSNHTAGIGTTGRLPALVYTATGKQEYLDATINLFDKIRRYSTHLSGGPVSVTEYLGPVGSTTETEYCSFAFYNATYSYLSFITGAPVWGDRMEEIFYNGAQGARKKDEKAIAYLTAPNQIYATMDSSAIFGDMQVYAPCYTTSCCPVNAVAVVPEFVRGMFLTDDADNVYVNVYGPSALDFNGISVRQITDYPFRNNVKIEIDSEKSFTLNLKVPEWAKSYSISLDGKAVALKCVDGYVSVPVSADKKLTAEISFSAEVKVIKVDDSDWAGKHPIAVKYGALLYAYHIPEKWEPIAGRPMTPLPDGWSWYNVNPDFEDAPVRDSHEQLGLRKVQFTWNVALDEALTEKDFEIEECDAEGYAWEEPKIKLHTHCYKAPYLCSPYQAKTLEPSGEYQYVTEKLPITLVPYGCTNLRITYFPKAKLEK